ncbi:MAG TPA: hypothetical protein VNB64_13190, partial [Solirubrobacteraceae bacterium]|nr:hypothetical protein [Solirubrobacteraceae bacterium]
ARLREELTERDAAQARAEHSIADLAGRIEQLQGVAAAARRSAEDETAVRELSAAAGEALAEAERRIGDAQRAATDAQERLDAERAERERAEDELRAAFDRERAELQRRLDAATTTLRADFEGRIAALEAALEAERRPAERPRPEEPRTAERPRPEEPRAAERLRPEEPRLVERPSPEAPRPAERPPAEETRAAGPVPSPARPEGESTAPEPPVPAPAAEPRSLWLPVGLERLAATSPGEAAKLGVQLLPAQALGGADGGLDYDLHVAGEWYAVTLRNGRGTVAPLDAHRARREADFRLDLDAPTLVRLLIEGGSPRLRKAGHFKVRGTLRRRRCARAIPAADLDLARLAEANVWPDPGLVLKAATGLVDPEWTRGHAFAVALVVLGPRGGRWRVRAGDGDPLDVGPAHTKQEAQATVRMTQAAFQRLLGGRPSPGDRRTHVAGDPRAVATLTGWIERAQRGAA